MNETTIPKTVLVTGAAKRLGRDIALGMARAGWNVVVHYRSSALDAQETAAQIRALGRQALTVMADLADQDDTDRLFDEAMQMPGLCCVINSASRFEYDDPDAFEYANLEAHARPNLCAPIRLARRLYDALGAEGRGVVINLLDQKLDHLNPDFFSYTLSKVGLLGATRMMAMAMAPRLRVVGVSPGITMIDGEPSGPAFERAHAHAPLGQSSTSADIVAAVLFLAGASAITGVNLIVDGGQHLLGLERDVMYLDSGAADARRPA